MSGGDLIHSWAERVARGPVHPARWPAVGRASGLPAGSRTDSVPLTARGVLALQKAAGNGAVRELMGSGHAVQRCGSIPPERCPCHKKDDDAESVAPAFGRPAVQRIAGDSPATSSHPTVRRGSHGPAVFELQVLVNLEAGTGLVADGNFGPRTRQDVVAFQTGRGLVPDGVAGPKTWTAIDAGSPAVPSPLDCATAQAALGRSAPDPLGGAQVAQALGEAPAACALVSPDLMAELVAILNNVRPTPPTPPPPIGKCQPSTDPAKVIASHTVSATKISAAGDTVVFTVDFTCLPSIKANRTIFSIIETTSGTSLGLRKPITMVGSTLTRRWDGKRLFKAIGTFRADDGDYQHRLELVTFAFGKGGKPVVTTAGMVSPTVTVDVRAKAGGGAHNTKANIALLASIIRGEMGIGNAAEQVAIGWAVRNQMLRLGTDSVDAARGFFHDQTGTAVAADTTLATAILSAKDMAGDTTNGAIKWFSPQSMPPRAGDCTASDCTGGEHPVTNTNTGKAEQVFFPGFTKTMTHQAVSGARDWFVMLYSL